MQHLSELVKDMSVGDNNIAGLEHSASRSNAPATVAEHPELSQVDGHTQLHRLSNSCDRQLSKLEVTTFQPPTASTPFRAITHQLIMEMMKRDCTRLLIRHVVV